MLDRDDIAKYVEGDAYCIFRRAIDHIAGGVATRDEFDMGMQTIFDAIDVATIAFEQMDDDEKGAAMDDALFKLKSLAMDSYRTVL